MADGALDTVLGWLRGKSANPQLGLEQAPPLVAYPNQADADYARHYGFGDNNIHEDYLNNNKAKILGFNAAFPLSKNASNKNIFISQSGAAVSDPTDPNNGADVDLNKRPELQGDLRNVMMRAALAANRSPITAMGFDPSKVNMDVEIKKPNIAGLYDGKTDSIYSALRPDDAIAHESTHRGIRKLQEKYPEDVQRIAGKIGPSANEMIVRWLMKSRAGDPEGLAGPVDAKQRQEAVDMFENNPGSHNAEIVRQLEELAIQDRLTRSRRSGPQ